MQLLGLKMLIITTKSAMLYPMQTEIIPLIILQLMFYKSGKYYLAGYKPFVAAHPDNSFYAATLYRVFLEDGFK